MYFVNEEHKENYDFLSEKYPLSYSDVHYQVACYFTGLPLIYENVRYSKSMESKNPCTWIFKYEKDPNDVDFDLTSSMVQIGRIMLNLWNGYEGANLSRCLDVLDHDHFIALITAIHIKRGYYKGV